MNNGGPDLCIKNITSFSKKLYYHPNDLIKPMYRVIKGLHEINKSHLHLDIKWGNILYNEQKPFLSY